jgi:hypothetical protein
VSLDYEALLRDTRARSGGILCAWLQLSSVGAGAGSGAGSMVYSGE